MTREGHIVKIISECNKSKYYKFKINDWVSEARIDHIIEGSIRYPYNASLFGVGYLGVGKYKSVVKKKMTKEYGVWRGMLRRCYSLESYSKNPSYIGCSVDKRWYNFQVFARWFDDNYVEGFELDKDLLIDGNKLYSEDTCVFIPSCLNAFLSSKQSTNTSGYTGVSWHKRDRKWSVQINDIDTHKLLHLGYFDDPVKASQIYKSARYGMVLRIIDKMILEYGITDTRILNAIR